MSDPSDTTWPTRIAGERPLDAAKTPMITTMKTKAITSSPMCGSTMMSGA